MARRIRITVTGRRGRWMVTGGGVTEMYTHKLEAIDAARDLCHRLEDGGALVQLVVHGRDGRIQFENTYGADPRRHKG